ncbi:MAG TPA: hypothetical protein VJK48_03215 [Chlamydiales bacterium]|nr:MAG: hypothetical protein A3F67_01415 [Verrucomicrobia bacterium RIFCSPHIGHO2_12_FULL_41_10]HLB52704.1 hypothetical protein [Chlamydiales bacterium]
MFDVQMRAQVGHIPETFFYLTRHAIHCPIQTVTALFAMTLPNILAVTNQEANERCLGTLTAITVALLSERQRVSDLGYLSTELIAAHELSQIFSKSFWGTAEELKQCPPSSFLIAPVCEGTDLRNDAYEWAAAVTEEPSEVSAMHQIDALHDMEEICYPRINELENRESGKEVLHHSFSKQKASVESKVFSEELTLLKTDFSIYFGITSVEIFDASDIETSKDRSFEDAEIKLREHRAMLCLLK